MKTTQEYFFSKNAEIIFDHSILIFQKSIDENSKTIYTRHYYPSDNMLCPLYFFDSRESVNQHDELKSYKTGLQQGGYDLLVLPSKMELQPVEINLFQEAQEQEIDIEQLLLMASKKIAVYLDTLPTFPWVFEDETPRELLLTSQAASSLVASSSFIDETACIVSLYRSNTGSFLIQNLILVPLKKYTHYPFFE